ncbi:hypothetical protein [Lentzea kentuckyensis]|uniref:hypothetical protein n=1 Tax=Lentzea kentuckyensis TaxID=360086 RepID=UPI000A38EB02|nr:hypothetical protein [Lentzea kentuckyensis]
MKRWLLVAGAVVLVLGLVTGGLWVFLTPQHRTTFLVDASESSGDFREVADAVGAAASNMSADDSLALRRFGGACDSSNTSELVTPGTGQAAKIGDAARAISPSGKATLLSGILAAIDDFARTYPFRGSATNQVVVVARGGADACGKSADEVRAIIGEHTARAGVKIDFRFVGHRLTAEQAKVLTQIAAASDAQPPRLTKTSDELVTTMKEVSVPSELAVKEVKTSPCDAVTPETLMAAHPLGSNAQHKAYYFDINCQQDRYVFAKAQTEPQYTDTLFLVFERKDESWQYLTSGTELPCGSVPKEVWTTWKFPCIFEPVVCRDGALKVTDLNGVGCPAAIDIADRYKAAIDGQQAAGQGTFWRSGEWSCSWPYEEGLAHSQVPLKCVRTTDNMVVQLGDYQR